MCQAREVDLKVGDEVELDVTTIAHGGICVARLDGRVVFVSDTIPGEKVRARLTEVTAKSFWRADTVRVLEPSPHRQEHVWAAAGIDRDPQDRPGGAEFGHISLPHQRELKSFVVNDSLQRMAGVARDVMVQAIAGDDERRGTGWRTRTRLHIDDQGHIGPYAARSHRVIEVPDLPLATERLQELWQSQPPSVASDSGITFVDLIDASGSDAVILLEGSPSSSVTEYVDDLHFQLPARGFWQVHQKAAVTLAEAVSSAIDDRLFDASAPNLDLYGGVGLFAAVMTQMFGPATKVTSVELGEEATDFAAENLAGWVGAQAVSAPVDKYLRQLRTQASTHSLESFAKATVVLDPPRSGAGKKVLAELVELAPAQLVYVACDPVALARDVKILAESGYTLNKLSSFDLFPNTHHVESVAQFVRG